MEIISLNGNWQVRQESKPESDWLPATVPGCVHTDLLAAEAIPDPYYRDNELQVMWVGEADWLYRRTFDVSASLLDHDGVLLRCDGLDTLATLWLNGVELGRTDNMFRIWEFDVISLLKPGQNEIVIGFDSALRFGKAKLKERYIHSWSTDQHKLPGGNYVRKSQCNFGWDWGPKCVTCGIWRDISLLGLDTARLADVHVRQDHSQPGQVRLSCIISAEKLVDGPLSALCSVALDGEEVDQQRVRWEGETAQVNLTVAEPKLWWPNGMGDQSLYTVSVVLADEAGTCLDTQHKVIGLRTLRLIRQPDEWGESFHFACNGVPFFAKGANWIPADTFVTRLTEKQYAQLLQAAADSHMNMLRVWGGGIYEQAIFYELCDRLGICIWQDFMFSCATYPTFDDAFMRNVELEAIDNIRRLRHHASIALWCGNNELEQGLVQEEWSDHAMSWADYSILFDQLLPKLVTELDPETDYWPASPHTPHENRYHWNDSRSGDAHIWDVWHQMEPFEFYYTCFHRFNSEFGFQSFPEPQMVRQFTEPEDENVTSYIMEHHQRSPSGNSRIMHYMLDWFRLPGSFHMTLWLSQILQGMAMKYAVEQWRRIMPRGMGTLYWQLNDCWPVASWSSIDYDGRWKALHHMARRFYAPVLLSAIPDSETGRVELHVTSDRLEELSGVMKWELSTVQGKSVASGTLNTMIRPNQNNPIGTLELKEEVERYGERSLLIWLTLLIDNAVVSENMAHFARPKHLSLVDPELRWQVEDAGHGDFRIDLSAAHPALWAWITSDVLPLQASDNFVHLRPGHPRMLKLSTGETGIGIKELSNSIRVYSLYDTYH